MDQYSAERVFLQRQREMIAAADRRQRLLGGRHLAGDAEQGGTTARARVATWLRAAADRIDRPALQRAA